MKQSTSGFLFALAELARLPNVFTAIADVMMGYLLTRGSLEPATWFVPIVASSVCLYWAGMVLNDVFDVEKDASERPDRPIPSGRIAIGTARALGIGLLASGFAITWYVGFLIDSVRPVAIGLLLAACIVLYNCWLKSTPVSPIAMGACRALNVLLGMSAAGLVGTLRPLDSSEYTIAIGVGVYIGGVTWFAKHEAQAISRPVLVGGLVVALAGIGIIASTASFTDLSERLAVTPRGWYLFWSMMGLILARRFVRAIVTPSPKQVQMAVKHGILSLIVIDAGICACTCGIYWGCAVLLLLAPAIVLGSWFYST